MDYLAFAIEPWEQLHGCRRAIMSRLARKHKLLLGTVPHYPGDLLDPARRQRVPAGGVTWRQDQLYTVSPPRLLFQSQRLPGWDRFSSELRVRQIRSALTKLQFGPLVLLLWYPAFAGMLGEFDAKISCYYVYDHFAGFLHQSDEQSRQIEENEDKILRTVDIVFTTGSGLFFVKNRYGNAVNVPNGVDFELFNRALSPATPIPEGLRAIPEPRLGYTGNLNEKVDFELLEGLATKRPEWSLVFVGADRVGSEDGRKKYESLRRHTNVYCLGAKPEAAIPGYLRGMNVCLIPYCMTGWSFFGCPLKLHEYLAAGKPVVSSDLPSVREFSSVVSIATSPADWVAAIDQCLADNNPEMTRRRVDVARANGWDRRIEVVETAISTKMAQKQPISGRDGAKP